MVRSVMLMMITAILLLNQAQICAQKKTSTSSHEFNPKSRQKGLSDSALFELVQKQTFRYFWQFAHPVSGMARERSNKAYEYGDEVVTTGGTGFGIMCIIVAAERGWIGRDTAVGHIMRIVKFLYKADAYHGAFPHWLNGATGKTIPFGRKDDGADLVETSFLMQGLLCARQYFNRDNSKEGDLRNRINGLWNDVEWNWFTKGGEDVLYWHWSPRNDWAMNFPVRGFNECLIMYVLAASAERYPVSASVYHRGWAQSNFFKNGHQFYGITLPLGFDYGGPLFFSHYSFLALDPRGLKDRYADYWEQNKNHTLINHEYCVRNPKGYKGYGPASWGLTACDTYYGYDAYSPAHDSGTIAPTAALSAFPYTPEYSMLAMKRLYFELGDRMWSNFGFTDSYNESVNWFATSHLAIDQGPIIVMMENYRSGLMWKLFMSCKEIKSGLKKLGFDSPVIN